MSAKTIRVLLAEDHTIVRKGLLSLLDAEAAVEVVGEAENGREAVEKSEALQPDIVIMDHTMPLLNGLEATRQIRARTPAVAARPASTHSALPHVAERQSADTYQQPTTSTELPAPPPPQELAVLLDMALKGELPRLHNRVVALGAAQPSYQAFIKAITELIDQYDEEGLLVLLQEYAALTIDSDK